ncbi:hypothetical protein [Quatrionicoccus australiensis]|uniref:hypothetical protein n=1 Tax=Quatrionicoccus australiensis TaxID=138118 RepID=UPI001CF936EF|nr:hypothetical protein [Quatrionicoccus australiensis]
MIQILQDQQTLFDNAMTFLALKMGYKAHTTSIVLVRGVVQTLLLRYCRFHHTHSLNNLAGEQRPMMKKAAQHYFLRRPVRKLEATIKYTGKPLSIQDAATHQYGPK